MATSLTDPTTGASSDLAPTLDAVTAKTDALARSADRFAAAMVKAFTSASVQGKQFDTVLAKLGLRLADLALRMALPSLQSGLQSLLGGLTGSSRVQPFASGGVIASPTYFPLAGGLGVAGEAGAEAILPLKRAADGRLGIAASGAGAPANVTVNIATPNADSFRTSQAYVSGQIARAVARGQRVL